MDWTLTVKTSAKTEFIDITRDIEEAIRSEGVDDGVCMLFVPHTTGAITINESADPSVKSDILMVLNKIVPWREAYRHLEGNSPAHIKASLIGPSEIIAVEGGRLRLGTWQGVFFCEFDGPRSRKVHIRLL
ncbi:MAG: YjbQ family protein [Deltaproteobacteria bacterium]|nr:YjbQ family protein [Deltaproteobacteria bacterium]MBW2075553.1 YjbQ family protein [Deltaproteobacteria bacterium]RLB80278.1 MAG: YjbQ family protein [Deltaproteobacteria bacterium]